MTQPDSEGGDFDVQHESAIDSESPDLMLTLPSIPATALLIDLLTDPPSPASTTPEEEEEEEEDVSTATREEVSSPTHEVNLLMDPSATAEAPSSAPTRDASPIDMLSL